MSIVRVGLAETKNFSEGYEAIFGKKQEQNTEENKEPADKQEQGKKEETNAKTK